MWIVEDLTMRRFVIAALLIAPLAAVAIAQDGGDRRGDRDDRGRRGRRGPSFARLIERMNEQLQFDEQQRLQVDEIAAAFEERQSEQRDLWREMREARESGDDARVESLREQMREAGRQRGEMMDQFFAEIEPVLRADQLDAFEDMRDSFSRQRGPRFDMRRMIEELPDAVEMTPEQREAFQELLQSRREAMRERMQNRRADDTGDAESDDEETDGQDRRRGRRGPGFDFAAMQDEFFAEVGELLNEDQQVLLTQYRERIEAERAQQRDRGRDRDRGDAFQTLFSASRRLQDLSSEQRSALRELEREAMRTYRELRGENDPEALAVFTQETKAEIVRLLEAEQVQEFETTLERLQSRDRGDRRDRPRRDRRRAAEDDEP